jgi:hypothetical protein
MLTLVRSWRRYPSAEFRSTPSRLNGEAAFGRLFFCAQDVACWHNSDIAGCPTLVRYAPQSGPWASSSRSDPDYPSRGLLALRDLKEAVALDTNVPTRVRVKRRASRGHQNPILGPYVRRQASARRSRQAQGGVSLTAIHVVGNFDVCIHAATVSAP